MGYHDYDKTGYWSPSTASVNWCENNYTVNYYIAELSLACAMGTLIGVGSVMFHGTLRHKMQLLDELPEVYLASVLFFTCVETRHGRQGLWLPVFLAMWLALVTYVASTAAGSTQFIFFQSSFAFMHLWIIYYVVDQYHVQTKHRPSLDQRWLGRRALASYAFAVSIWLIDLKLCEYTNGLSPTSWTPFPLHLHAWWHIFSALGVYLTLALVCLQHYESMQLRPYMYIWKGILPAIGLHGATHDKVA
ncbi:Alkaline ceramidase 3 [Actinomortierella ambigua]|nr:Alkaline ceramidase 3 [Actinomortierella ambigua]